MAEGTISIVCQLSLREAVRGLVHHACSWAARPPDTTPQDTQSKEFRLRLGLETQVRRLVAQFFDYQHLVGGTGSFPWEEDLREVVEVVLEVFRRRYFNIRRPDPTSDDWWAFPKDDVSLLLPFLIEACQPWLGGEK